MNFKNLDKKNSEHYKPKETTWEKNDNAN